jgi:hypothetical protein
MLEKGRPAPGKAALAPASGKTEEEVEEIGEEAEKPVTEEPGRGEREYKGEPRKSGDEDRDSY